MNDSLNTLEEAPKEIAPIEGDEQKPLETGDLEDAEKKPETDEEAIQKAADEKATLEAEPKAEPTNKEILERLEKAEKRVGYLQRKAARPGAVPEKQEPAGAKPDESSFETNAEFVEALTDWKVDQRDRTNAETRAVSNAKERMEDFFSVIDSGVDKYPDFNEVARKLTADGGPDINAAMMEALEGCDNVVDIAYFFGQNVEESKRIARLGAIGAAREITKLDIKFSSGTVPQKVKKTTITTPKPVAGTATPDRKLEDLSTDDFMKSRNQAAGVG